MTGPLTARGSVIDIPDEPDWARMRRETGARLRSAMADHGVDALILLMNGYVGYATGASWPLLDAGLSHAERPRSHRCPTTTCTARCILNSTPVYSISPGRSPS